jgi:hypothetical protein
LKKISKKGELALPSVFDLPEDVILKREIEDSFGRPRIEYTVLKDGKPPLLPNKYASDFSEKGLGNFIAYTSDTNPEELIVMTSDLEDEVQRKGIARKIYKQAELDTGKKILPDQILSKMSAPLHAKYGLGKEFGLENYEDVIKEGASKLTSGAYPEYSQDYYDRVKRIMKAVGLDKFKSIVPFLKPVAAVAGGIGYSDIAGAATDVIIPGGLEETAIADERAIPDPRYQEYIKRMSQRKK